MSQIYKGANLCRHPGSLELKFGNFNGGFSMNRLCLGEGITAGTIYCRYAGLELEEESVSFPQIETDVRAVIGLNLRQRKPSISCPNNFVTVFLFTLV